MNHKEIAGQLVQLLGGKENVVSATHCATRLRLVIEDENQIEKTAIEELDEVKGAFSSSGQFQIIFGTGTVNKVFTHFGPLVGASTGGEDSGKSVSHKEAAKNKMHPLARFARTLSNIFVPIIPAIVAAGMLMGLLGLMDTYNWVDPESGLFVMLDMFSSAAFIILPILIGYSAAKEFGGNTYLGAVIGGIMTHPGLLNPWGLADAQPETLDFLGFGVEMLGYQGTVIPVLLTVYVMAKLEQGFRRIVPNAVDLLLTPFLTVIFTGFVAMLVIGPLGRTLGNGLTSVLGIVYDTAGPMAGLIFGGLYSTIVLTGVHHSFHAIEAELLNVGGNYLLPIWAMANVAQGGATIAVFFKTKNKKTKEIALPAGISAFLGITEPAIFGVNLKYRRPFIGAAIGGALGGAYVVFTKVMANGIGLTGLPMFAIAQDPVNYGIGCLIAIGGSIVSTLLLSWKEETK
ncbi:PTS system sucrose-specific IIB component, Glc family /PTS system sucrose-specific IIC component, Glc family [Halobacillus karajensis]|uniref:PTS system sac EIIBC component n=1 Tax=Halobacillus karajensis TaxID=195088 RepID=A0A059NYS1_9BACI|nr:sucrose-specific PTS transporter subunit IIBC [Halobacillus karajensis]CDQ18532.1 PTS system sac EIIBC component [Halobacillus karajensis]CDQ23396.1 PTS system sac EIIBC component [Halobacillus karajensis]CDQ26878.1 PTS system sac EIIBC component [Halobacillus karajensis]SEH50283.1 PTS system sucrose-specific IIB component, Glc family /PTS system sucrose-specific IIC component, Glc family [Halobacillus karajensis]